MLYSWRLGYSEIDEPPVGDGIIQSASIWKERLRWELRCSICPMVKTETKKAKQDASGIRLTVQAFKKKKVATTKDTGDRECIRANR
jgi:hypothetical protein